MRNVAITLALLFGVGISANTYAAQWFYNLSIQHLYVGQVGNRYAIKFQGSQPNPEPCDNSDDLVIDDLNPRLKEIWASLLAARVSNTPVSVYVSGCSASSRKPIITDIIM